MIAGHIAFAAIRKHVTRGEYVDLRSIDLHPEGAQARANGMDAYIAPSWVNENRVQRIAKIRIEEVA